MQDARGVVAAVACLSLLLGHAQGPPDVTCARQESASRDPGARTAALSLYCVDLVPPPLPELQGISGSLELRPVPSAFGVAVTPSGAPRYLLIARVRGLPAPASLGAYAAYVAWTFTVTMDSVVRLGEIRNGETRLGEVAREQFRILVTAERTPDVATRSSRIVLRATSPGARLLAHRDLMQPVPPGVGVMSANAPHEHGLPMSDAPTGSRMLTWRMPPMPSTGSMTMPGMGGLEPRVSPWLPSAGASMGVADAVPRRVVSLGDGDTLDLIASLVRRNFAGRQILAYAFNGQYPGPLLRVPQGATVVVRFENRLDQPSTVHWHGVRLDNRFDGVPDITQRAVAPGSRFVYRVRFRDAGIYWYHPHVREDVQQDLGLYGNILVASPDRRLYPPVDQEEVLTLDDILMDGEGILPFGSDVPTHALMGRWGNVFLINGEPHWRLRVHQGEVVRFYLTNVSNARTYNLELGGARMKVIATDGGRFEHERWTSSVVIAPAERYVVDVRFDDVGDIAIVNRVQALDHMYGTYATETDTLGIVTVSPDPRRATVAAQAFERLRDNGDVATELARYRRYITKPPDHTLVLDLRVRDLPRPVAMMLNGLNVPMDWNDGMGMANWVSTGREVTWILRDAETGRENLDITWGFRRGALAKLRLFNDPTSVHAMAHPIHLHGQRFLVLARNGVPNENLAWKDTAIIPAGEVVDLLVEMANPGRWLLHCHVAEHMGAGMMLAFLVR
jgi:FtsP/CotA-like multicopper oxidase with cupredoxin domain